MRQLLRNAGLRVPWFTCFPCRQTPVSSSMKCYTHAYQTAGAVSQSWCDAGQYPEEFVKAFWRLRALLETPAIRLQHDEVHDTILVEKFIPGFEVAPRDCQRLGACRYWHSLTNLTHSTALLRRNSLHHALTRLKAETQDAITCCTEQAAHALGLVHGPLHAELRINQEGPWILEVAAWPSVACEAARYVLGPGRPSLNFSFDTPVALPCPYLLRTERGWGDDAPHPARWFLAKGRGTR